MYRIDSVPKEGKMENYRFHLEKYKTPSSRYICPECGQKRTFVRYIDSEGAISFPHYVGRCNREQKCGYHYTPKQYFEENQIATTGIGGYSIPKCRISRPIEPSFISSNLMQKSLKHYQVNHLFHFIKLKFGKETTLDLFTKYNVGTANYWNGATVFWQKDILGRVRTGKIMLYDSSTGKRIKKPHNHITWAHSLMDKGDYHLKQCFFGEHLLSENKSSPVALVESEKTALIASIYIPQYIWIATGGKNGCLNRENMQVLTKRKVVLFPDLGAKEYWSIKSEQMQELGINVIVSDYLERNASKEQIEEGYDIADFLMQNSPLKNIYETFVERNPILKTLVETFDLKLVEVSNLSPRVARLGEISL